MPYSSVISRDDATALIPEEAANSIIKSTTESSSVLRLARRLQDMSRKQFRMPVLSVLPSAYFVAPGSAAENSKKQTTEVNWENVYINAEELAVIVPIPEVVLDDTDFAIWDEIRPVLVEAFGKAIDEAVLYSTNKPNSWPTGIVPAAVTAGHSVQVDDVGPDLYGDLMGEGGVLSKIEEDGFYPTGHIAHLSMRAKLRGVRSSDGVPLFQNTPAGSKFSYELDGMPLEFPRNGAIDAAESLLISGDWSNLVYAFRQDITWKILDQAVIQDASGNILYNLAQQDMVAMRAVMRLGWQLPNPANRVQPTKASRYQFAVLKP